ncbi:GtrA family protein [Sutcliffiella horikoshii]|uniref:GtrA family protein n=1 Tax=Sutcliffiella horikoshii TaxID=79883 RepID=A0A5D4T538_9BACI|nr:GtrA family protein [Sutcliffiella horikoshii]TYS69788.1 GtrA family protein [Sutcliffiella horikoshii]
MKRLLKFGTVGVFNTLITFASFTILYYLGLNYLVANVIGYCLGVLNSYYWNKRWVFQDNRKRASIFYKFIAVNVLTLGVQTLFLFLLVNKLGLQPVLANLVAIGASLFINYFLNAKWTFFQEQEQKAR